MIAITEEVVTLLSVEPKSFKDKKDGHLIEYVEAKLLDNDGNKFTITVDKEAQNAPVGSVRSEGTARVALFVTSFDNRQAIKMRLMGWTPA